MALTGNSIKKHIEIVKSAFLRKSAYDAQFIRPDNEDYGMTHTGSGKTPDEAYDNLMNDARYVLNHIHDTATLIGDGVVFTLHCIGHNNWSYSIIRPNQRSWKTIGSSCAFEAKTFEEAYLNMAGHFVAHQECIPPEVEGLLLELAERAGRKAKRELYNDKNLCALYVKGEYHPCDDKERMYYHIVEHPRYGCYETLRNACRTLDENGSITEAFKNGFESGL